MEKALKIHGILGKAFCGCAGAILGFFVAGPYLALAGIFAGVMTGECLERLALKNFLES